MINVFVKKNDEGMWIVAGVITSPYNVRGLKTGVTYSDIRYMDKETLIADGIWQQEDFYENNDEYLEFDKKETTFDEVEGIVTNTYKYKRMDLDFIKNDLGNRVSSYREYLINSGYDHNGKMFGTDVESRQWLTSLVVYISLNPALETIDIRIPSGEVINMPVAEFEELYCDIIEHIKGFYTKEVQIINAINATLTYEDARAAAVWDGVPL